MLVKDKIKYECLVDLLVELNVKRDELVEAANFTLGSTRFESRLVVEGYDLAMSTVADKLRAIGPAGELE